MKALHVFYTENTDSKIASSVVYEYFYKYRKDIGMHKFHRVDEDCTNIDISSINKKDTVVLIGLNVLNRDNLMYDIIDLVDTNNELYWIERYDPFVNLFSICCRDISKMSNVNIIFDPELALSYNTYKYFKTLTQGEENNKDPMTLDMINEFIGDYNPSQETREFMYGLYCIDFSAKNFFKNIFNGSKLADIFEYSPFTSKIEHEYLQKIQSIGKNMYSRIKKIDNKEKLKYRGFEAFIIDAVHNKCHSCYVINCADPDIITKNIISRYDFTCTFIKLANGEWEHTFRITDTDYIDLDFIASALLNHEKHYYYDDALVSIKDHEFTLITNNCIFDHDNRITIYEKLISKKIKVKYDAIE